MDYPHQITIRRPTTTGTAGGTQDPDTGVFTDDAGQPDDSLIYEGRCDAQDKGEVIKRDQAGQPILESDITCFLSKERLIADVKVDDLAKITWEDASVTNTRVMMVRRLDAALLLKRE